MVVLVVLCCFLVEGGSREHEVSGGFGEVFKGKVCVCVLCCVCVLFCLSVLFMCR